jgi:hypothetical protein
MNQGKASSRKSASWRFLNDSGTGKTGVLMEDIEIQIGTFNERTLL